MLSAKAIRNLKNKVVPFEWVPLSSKQQKVMAWWAEGSPYKDYDGIIADGAVRSGKTVSLAMSYVTWAMESFNGKNFALCGRTIHAHRRNVIKPLKSMLKSRGYSYLDVKDENVLIIYRKYVRPDGTIQESMNYFYIFGGKDEAAAAQIQGLTLAGAFFDEVALMPESFVVQATARCSETGAKFWFSCNPDSPFHWFKREWIDKVKEKKLLYLHFTMPDNPSLSLSVIERYRKLYHGIFYKRMIEGKWVMADGIVFPMFESSKNMVEYDRPWTRTFISIDYGTQNATTFGLYGFYQAECHYHLIDYYYHSGKDASKESKDNRYYKGNGEYSELGADVGQKTAKEYVDELIEFIRGSNIKPEYIIIDPSAAPLIVEMKKRTYFKRRNIRIINARNSVLSGIQIMAYMIKEGKFTLAPHCVKDEAEFGAYMWCEKAAMRGEDDVVKQHDHCMDRNRYAVYTDALRYKTLGATFNDIVSGKGAIDY